jgi:hypothetical protein
VTEPTQETSATEVATDTSGKTEYVEFVGWQPYGTQFTGVHTIGRKHMADVHDIKTTKDLTWTKGANGRFLLKTADVDPAVLDYLKTDPAFKVVTI